MAKDETKISGAVQPVKKGVLRPSSKKPNRVPKSNLAKNVKAPAKVGVKSK